MPPEQQLLRALIQELASKGRIVEDVVGALRTEEAAKLAAQRDAQTARTRMHQLEVPLLASPQLHPSFQNLFKLFSQNV